MRQVVFTYKKLWRHSIKRMLPTNYAEMTPAQFLATVRLTKGWIDERQFFLQFYGLTDRLLSRLDAFQLYTLTDSLEFLKDFRSSCTGFYFKTLPGNLLAPAAKLRDMSFQQFMTVDTYFSWYLCTEKDIFLNQFIAALYLKADESYHPDKRQKGLDLAARTGQVNKIPMDLKYAVMVNWVLVKSWLSHTYPHLFPQGEPASNAKGDKVKHKPVDWLALFDAFVGDNIPSIEAYKVLPCMDAFRLLNRRIKESQKK